VLLRRRVGPVGLRRIVETFWRAGLAALAAAAVGWGASTAIGWVMGGGRLTALVQLVIGGAVILAGYLGFALALRVTEVRDVVAMVRRRLGRTRSPA
jgi:putative peptidoglycan lipid II flippase